MAAISPRIALDLTLVGLIAVVLFFSNLGRTRLWDRDEPRNAGCAREMLARGDWVTPVFDNQLRKAKPVLLYWLIMSATWAFGDNEFGARFWSAALGAGTVVLTYLTARRLFDRNVGFWSGVILASCLMFDVASRAATPDSTLIFCSAASIAAFVLFAPPSGFGTWRWTIPVAFTIYGLMALGTLAKGPVGFLLPTAVIGLFLLFERSANDPSLCRTADRESARWRSWAWQITGRLRTAFAWSNFRAAFLNMRPGIAVLAIASIAFPWYIWVGFRTDGEWLRGFFLEENIGRAMQPLENHRGSIVYYPIAIAIGFFPWSIFLVPMFLDGIHQVRNPKPLSTSYRLLFCWCATYVCVFSLAQTKLPSYVTPMYPALAMLAGRFLCCWTVSESMCSEIWPKISLAVLALAGIGCVVGIPLAAQQYFPGDELIGSIGIVLILGAIAGAWAIHSGHRKRALLGVAVSATIFVWLLFAVASTRLDRHQQSGRLLAAIDRASEFPVVGSFGCLEPSWVYYGRRPIAELTLAMPGGAGDGATQPAPANDLASFIGKPDHFVFMTRRTFENIRPQLGDSIHVVDEAPYFLKKDSLVVVTSKSSVAQHPDSWNSLPRR